jgi:hypothetical protein
LHGRDLCLYPWNQAQRLLQAAPAVNVCARARNESAPRAACGLEDCAPRGTRALGASAPPMTRLDDLTWPECRSYVQQDGRLLLPVGTCEQHGPHLPLGTDTWIAEHVAAWLSDEAGVLVAPTVAYGVNLPCDRLFWGTASVPEAVLRAYLGATLEWWRDQTRRPSQCPARRDRRASPPKPRRTRGVGSSSASGCTPSPG